MILYGRVKTLRDLDERRSNVEGDDAHERAAREQEQELAKQDVQERQREQERD